MLSTRTKVSLRPWRVFNEANTRGVPRSGEGVLVTLGQTEQQHGGRSFSSRVLCSGPDPVAMLSEGETRV